jgi:hypothetical protein
MRQGSDKPMCLYVYQVYELGMLKIYKRILYQHAVPKYEFENRVFR